MLLGPALGVSAILFSIGVLGVLLRRNAIIILMCVELMLNAVNLTFVALAQQLGPDGQVFVFFVMAVAAAPRTCRSRSGRSPRICGTARTRADPAGTPPASRTPTPMTTAPATRFSRRSSSRPTCWSSAA